ncbi:MAG: N-acetylmuramoyl-L-alanine amidase, partial [bacterium]
LVEAAFITNLREEQKLSDTNFRDKIAKGVVEGIKEYMEKLQ